MKQIVIVDDEESVTETLAFFLGTQYNVTVFRDGDLLIKQLNDIEFDLLITDLLMERIDGIALTRLLRAHPKFKDTPIIMISAMGKIEEENAYRVGISHFLHKPFNMTQVMELVEQSI